LNGLPRIGTKISLTDKAYETIKDAIMTNYFKPGELLIEEKLAEKLAISRTPLRAALKRLAYEHLVDINSSRNVIVSNVSQQDVEKITVVRQALEPVAVLSLENKIKGTQVEDLRKIVEREEEASIKKEYDELIKMEYEFHVSIAKFTDNEWIYEMVKNINTIIQRFLILSGSLNRYNKLAIEEHGEILKEIENGRYNKAAENMKIHIIKVSNRMLK
jgi:DNA-binding GntR family transcriptional regulator